MLLIHNYNNIPDALKQRPQWVVWGVPGEVPKAPFNPESLLRLEVIPAKSGVPETWGSFENAVRCVSMGVAQGIGYEFNGHGIYGVDLDNVIDVHEVITPQAREIVDALASYTEISPSGKGLHIFVTADVNAVNITRHRKQSGFVEIYTNARYFTMTGNIYCGFNQISDRPAELQQIHDRYLLPEQSKTVTPAYSVGLLPNTPDYLKRGLAYDGVLRVCWNGERRHGDESAADQALMNKLAYWCNADQSAMIAAFMQSPHYMGKDETHKRKCQRADYLPNTAKTACATLRSTAYEDTQRYQQARLRNGVR